ncbi:hypothetical protein A1O3_09785 [Capronia epimyces CBS 606.96]|uniref:alpha-1,2-Mannosidase n=1 Tax=Capronia epimyces CBS 606.96 TaxID=1182542 RepID=W9XBG7_9EURO|nr:uncharacterized protein A1O3_09785 [Capronia epimyces CBS 606.96]EXJ77558.1 hypothetical protein A1O3_09785 [Capronia epimyces CBS 606.96]
MALPFSRRWTLFLTLTVIFLLFLYQVHIYRPSRQPPTPIKPYKPAPQSTDGSFHWENRVTHYPLESLTPLPTERPKTLPRVQHEFSTELGPDRELRLQRRQDVKDAFTRCWQSYRVKAWMLDELSPISGAGRNSFGGWAATLVDSLDTLWIMDLRDEFHEATHSSMVLNFSTSTDNTVNIFETTIRYLGGFLAAHDLSGDAGLLHKAVEVGEMLLVAFDTPNHMPITRWEWQKAANGERQTAPDWMLVSELGSLSVEFTRLSQLTGDHRWYDAIQRITSLFDEQQQKTKIPGLWPVVVNPRDQDLTADTTFTLGGMSDSLYEYFPKEYALLGGVEPTYQKLYEQSVSAAIKHLFFRPMVPLDEDILMSGDARANNEGSSVVVEPRAQHLTCFAGGMLALGGRLFSNEEHVSLGQKITKGCIWAYENMPAGVMPEIAHLVPCQSKQNCTWSTDLWTAAVMERTGDVPSNKNADEIIVQKRVPPGYTDIDDRRYILRPEAIESVFILYRVTGDNAYREAAWKMFTAIQNITQTEYGNAAISDITAIGADGLPPKDDRMESFWLAETLKYFYLIFSDPELVSLDEYVLNTEAHPLRRPF